MHAITASPWALPERRARRIRQNPSSNTRTFAALTAAAAVLLAVVGLKTIQPGGNGGGLDGSAPALVGNGTSDDGERGDERRLAGANEKATKKPTKKDGATEKKKGAVGETGLSELSDAEKKAKKDQYAKEKAAKEKAWKERFRSPEQLAAMSKEEREEYYSHVDTPYMTHGDQIRLYTTNGIDFGERMLVTAEAAYRRANQFFGTSPRGDVEQFHIYVVRNTEQYNKLGAGWNGDDKSSLFYAFATPWMKSEMKKGYAEEGMQDLPDLASITQFSQAESLTEIYVTHATVEQFVRRLVGPDAVDPAPRWFIDGVACYLGRWQNPNLFNWSHSRLQSLGGTPKLKSYFNSYVPNEQFVLSAGVMIGFLKSDGCPDDLRGTFQKAVISVNDGKKIQKAFRRLEKGFTKHETEFRGFANL